MKKRREPRRPIPTSSPGLTAMHKPLTWEFSSLCLMTPQTRVRVACIAIAIAIVIGVAGAIIGNWFVVVLMVLAVLGQVVSLRANRQRPGGRGGG
jgi:hypothetical protein